MALSLITEVVAYLPGSDLTSAERLVLFAVAEHANSTTREAYQCDGSNGKRRWVLAEVVGLSATGLRDAFQRLAKRDLEIRVAFGKDSSGRVLYAVYGRQTTYRLPLLSARVGDGQTSPHGDGRPSGRGDGVAPPGDGQAPPGDGRPSPFSSASRMHLKGMHASEPWQIVAENTGAKPSEAKAIVTRILNERRNVRTPAGLIVKMAKDGDLNRYLNELRTAQKVADDDQDRRLCQGKPRCDHGVAGGTEPHSITGEIRCRACRKQSNLLATARSAEP